MGRLRGNIVVALRVPFLGQGIFGLDVVPVKYELVHILNCLGVVPLSQVQRVDNILSLLHLLKFEVGIVILVKICSALLLRRRLIEALYYLAEFLVLLGGGLSQFMFAIVFVCKSLRVSG